MPDVRAGYINQSVEGIRGLQAAQAGVSIPIFYQHYNRRVVAAKLAAKAQEYHYQEYLLQWEAAREIAENQFQSISSAIKVAETVALAEAKSLTDMGIKAFAAGEIDFLAFAQLIQQSITIEERYLEQIAQYNSTLVQLTFFYAEDRLL
jgi:cobalt-zinc-cadmium resistance protein CzcA